MLTAAGEARQLSVAAADARRQVTSLMRALQSARAAQTAAEERASMLESELARASEAAAAAAAERPQPAAEAARPAEPHDGALAGAHGEAVAANSRERRTSSLLGDELMLAQQQLDSLKQELHTVAAALHVAAAAAAAAANQVPVEVPASPLADELTQQRRTWEHERSALQSRVDELELRLAAAEADREAAVERATADADTRLSQQLRDLAEALRSTERAARREGEAQARQRVWEEARSWLDHELAHRAAGGEPSPLPCAAASQGQPPAPAREETASRRARPSMRIPPPPAGKPAHWMSPLLAVDVAEGHAPLPGTIAARLDALLPPPAKPAPASTGSGGQGGDDEPGASQPTGADLPVPAAAGTTQLDGV
jgi:hypothetical protein